MKQSEDIKFAISYHALIILIAANDWIGSIGKLTELTHQYQYLPFLSDISLATVYIKDVKRGAEHTDKFWFQTGQTDGQTHRRNKQIVGLSCFKKFSSEFVLITVLNEN